MRRFVSLFVLLSMLACATVVQAAPKISESYGPGPSEFTLATGSPGELGLLKVLGEAFGKKEKAKLNWVKAGSGASLDLLKAKEVDMIMVHAPKAEKAALEEGWATNHSLIGSNEFYIVGPKKDPAKIAKAKSAAEAYALIAGAQAKFYSRGDNSGTHKKELAIWKTAEVTPAGDWYIISKGFMTATLLRADAEQGYFMTDSSTWAAAKKDVKGLKILFRGDKFLINTYHTLCQPEGATPGAAMAAKFITFVGSPAGQKLIRSFGKKEHGAPLYNDAAYAKQYE
ncbi:MAG: ABC transporter substrate-binding protein [Deltaproteobacteria bacterium HGW-Deltaproteobacteria-8]|jgi:tungstate transport system substrate-binding protein|nr:MAG: ABC transporter substrate-binding protein [Deltaproteobacteria bacterium HGW-Deltaproteobacteria-8]